MKINPLLFAMKVANLMKFQNRRNIISLAKHDILTLKNSATFNTDVCLLGL